MADDGSVTPPTADEFMAAGPDRPPTAEEFMAAGSAPPTAAEFMAAGQSPAPMPAKPSPPPQFGVAGSPQPSPYQALGSRLGIDPANVAAIVMGESGGNPRARTGSYYGMAQLSQPEVEATGTDWNAYKGMSGADQLAVWEKVLAQRGFRPEMGLKGLAMIQAAPGYLKKAMSGWDGVIPFHDLDAAARKQGYASGYELAKARNPHWVGPDGQIRPSSITAYYRRATPMAKGYDPTIAAKPATPDELSQAALIMQSLQPGVTAAGQGNTVASPKSYVRGQQVTPGQLAYQTNPHAPGSLAWQLSSQAMQAEANRQQEETNRSVTEGTQKGVNFIHDLLAQTITRNPFLGGNPIDPNRGAAGLPWNKPVVDTMVSAVNPLDQAALLGQVATDPASVAVSAYKSSGLETLVDNTIKPLLTGKTTLENPTSEEDFQRLWHDTHTTTEEHAAGALNTAMLLLAAKGGIGKIGELLAARQAQSAMTADMGAQARAQAGAFAPQAHPGLILGRHGEVVANEAGLIRGVREPGDPEVQLTPKGMQESDATASQIASHGVSAIYSSPQDRALAMAAMLSDKTGLPVQPLDALNPWHLGDLQGLPGKTVGPIMDDLVKNPDQRPPGGETFNEYKQRILPAVKQILDAHAGEDQPPAIISHLRSEKIVQAWLDKGMPDDLSINEKMFLDRSGEQTGSTVKVSPNGEGGFQAGPLETPGVRQSGQRGAGINLFDPQTWENPKTNIATLKNALTDSMRNMIRVSPDSAAAYAQMVGSGANIDVAMRTAVREMGRLSSGQFGRDAGLFDRVVKYLSQDNLNAIRRDAETHIASIKAMKDFEHEYPGSAAEHVVQMAEGRTPVGGATDSQSLTQVLLDSGKIEDARQSAIDALSGLGRAKNFVTDEEFAALRNDPRIQSALPIWDRTVGAAVSYWHKLHGGVDTPRLGESGRFIPFVRATEGGELAGSGKGIRLPLQAPKNMGNIFRTGSSTYTTERAALGVELKNRAFRSAKANFLKVLNDSGLVRPTTAADQSAMRAVQIARERGDQNIFAPRVKGPQIVINGLSHDATIQNTTPMLMTKNANGRIVPIRGADVTVPEWLMRETRPGLEPGRDTDIMKVSRAITTPFNWIATKGVAESIFHGRSVLAKGASSALGADHPLLFMKSLVESPHSENFRSALDYMSKNGMLPQRTAMNIGGQFLNPVQRAVWGEGGLDVRSRYAAFQVASKVADRMGLDGSGRANFIRERINRIGAYNMALESNVVRSLKQSGLNQFATSGMANLRGKINTGLFNFYPLEMRGKLPASATIGYALRRQILASGAGKVALWHLGYYALTGRTPEEDAARFLEIPLDKLGFHGKSLNVAAVDPVSGGGLTLWGVRAGYNTNVAKGENPWQMPDYQGRLAMIRDALNSGASIVTSGPPVEFGSKITGMGTPQIGAFIDDKGKPQTSFMSTSDNLPFTSAGAKAALWGLNPTTELIGEKYAGEAPSWTLRDDAEKSNLEKATDVIIQTLFPGLVRDTKDLTGTGRYLQQQERALERRR